MNLLAHQGAGETLTVLWAGIDGVNEFADLKLGLFRRGSGGGGMEGGRGSERGLGGVVVHSFHA